MHAATTNNEVCAMVQYILPEVPITRLESLSFYQRAEKCAKVPSLHSVSAEVASSIMQSASSRHVAGRANMLKQMEAQ